MKDLKLGSTDLIISLTAAGRPQAEVADAAGISVRTLRRRLQEPQILVAVSAAVVQLEKEAVGRLGQLRRRAFDQLETLLQHEDPSVVLRTCRLVLDAGLAHRAAIAEDNLAHLEMAVAEGLTSSVQHAGGAR